MKCPHCSIGVLVPFETYFSSPDYEIFGSDDDYGDEMEGYRLVGGHCPQCGGYIVAYEQGLFEFDDPPETRRVTLSYRLTEVEDQVIVYPKHASRSVAPEVPEPYRSDFIEAAMVLSISPKASAALSRRVLQSILNEKYQIRGSNLHKEIEQFIKRTDIPQQLRNSVDAIRHVGNLAAHPTKYKVTGEIVEVEPKEADVLLIILESLFEHAFIQPKLLAERLDMIEQKVAAAGKPPLQKALPTTTDED